MHNLDTNILMANHNNIELINDDIVLSILVLEELDKHKSDMTEGGYHARKSIKLIDKAISNDYILDNDFKLIIDTEYNKDLDNDSNIRNLTYLYKDCVFVTNDIASKVRAKSEGINTISLSDGMIKDLGKIQTIDTDVKILNMLEANGMIDPRIIDTEFTAQNTCYVFKSDKEPFSVLARRIKNHIVKINPPKRVFNSIEPKNVGQKFYAEMLLDDRIKVLLVTGKSGSAKSLLALAAGLEIVNSKRLTNKIICLKSLNSVESDIGFLPGSALEKLQPFYESFNDNLNLIADLSGNYREKGFDEIENECISFIRGRTFRNSFIISDENQNISNNTIKTIISRAGENSKVVICGDLNQIDNPKNSKHNNGLFYAQTKLYNNPMVGIISLEKTERSEISELANLL